jgi:hypothetical protein
MARSKLPEDTVIRLVKCQRWGVCDEGTADICDVEIKTVHCFQRVPAHRAETHHRQSVQHVEVAGVQLEEAHSKLCPKQVEWVHTALAMGSWFLLWVDFGLRTQGTAATLIAQVSRAPGSSRSFSRMGGKPIQRHCSKSLGECIVAGTVGQWAASRSPSW